MNASRRRPVADAGPGGDRAAAGAEPFVAGDLADRGPLERGALATAAETRAREARELQRQKAWSDQASRALNALKAEDGTGPVNADDLEDDDLDRLPLGAEEGPDGGDRLVPGGSPLPTLRVLPQGISRKRLEQAVRDLQLPVVIARDVDEADVVMTLRNEYKQKTPMLRDAEDRGGPDLRPQEQHHPADAVEPDLDLLARDRPPRGGHARDRGRHRDRSCRRPKRSSCRPRTPTSAGSSTRWRSGRTWSRGRADVSRIGACGCIRMQPAAAGGDRRDSRLDFIGHSAVVIEIDGVRLLTDPVTRARVGPLRRVEPVPARERLRDIDAILISHLHWDHLDVPSLRHLGRDIPAYVPAGSGAWMRSAGFGDVREIAVGETASVGSVVVRAVEAIHSGYRPPLGPTAPPLGFVVRGSRTIYFAGDTDLFDGMGTLGEPIDVALIPVWGWGPTLGRGLHLDPMRAAAGAPAHQATGGGARSTGAPTGRMLWDRSSRSGWSNRPPRSSNTRRSLPRMSGCCRRRSAIWWNGRHERRPDRDLPDHPRDPDVPGRTRGRRDRARSAARPRPSESGAHRLRRHRDRGGRHRLRCTDLRSTAGSDPRSEVETTIAQLADDHGPHGERAARRVVHGSDLQHHPRSGGEDPVRRVRPDHGSAGGPGIARVAASVGQHPRGLTTRRGGDTVARAREASNGIDAQLPPSSARPGGEQPVAGRQRGLPRTTRRQHRGPGRRDSGQGPSRIPWPTSSS